VSAASPRGDREILPVLALYDSVLFPGARCRVLLGTARAYGAVREATRAVHERTLAVFGTTGGEPEPRLFPVGALAHVLSLQRSRCCGQWVADIVAVARVREDERLLDRPFRISRVERLVEPAEDPALVATLVDAVRVGARRLLAARCRTDAFRCAVDRVHEVKDAGHVLGAAADLLASLPVEEQQRGLELERLSDRLVFLIGALTRLAAPPSRRRKLDMLS
jgi:Lon protease-like protein